MRNNLRCPDCGGSLTLCEEGQVKSRVWLKELWGVATFVINRPFVSCDRCEWVFDGKEAR